MKIAFACDSCGSRYEAHEAHAGRSATCKRCGQRMTVPAAAPAGPDIYAVAEQEAPVSVFSPARAAPSAPIAGEPPRPSPPAWLETPTRPKKKRKQAGTTRWQWAVGGAAATAAVLLLVTLLVPGGKMIAGMVLTLAGMLLILIGFAAGAYGAFSEDLIYGILYLFVPLYTGYYLVTRWDDLKPWFLGMAAGAALAFVGISLMESGLPAGEAEARIERPGAGWPQDDAPLAGFAWNCSA